MNEILGDLYDGIRDGLRGQAHAWWDEHEDAIRNYSKQELAVIAQALARGDTRTAEKEVIARMSLEEWDDYKAANMARLYGVAARRAKMLEALEDLGRRTARIVGKSLLAVFGLG